MQSVCQSIAISINSPCTAFLCHQSPASNRQCHFLLNFMITVISPNQCYRQVCEIEIQQALRQRTMQNDVWWGQCLGYAALWQCCLAIQPMHVHPSAAAYTQGGERSPQQSKYRQGEAGVITACKMNNKCSAFSTWFTKSLTPSYP